MQGRRTNWARLVAGVSGLVTAGAVYVMVAPFRCDPAGSCHGLVAFDYPPGSAAQMRALGAALLVGSAVALPLWVALSPPTHANTVLRTILSVVLVGFIGISLLSHSVLIILGPLLGGIFLWLTWSRNAPARRSVAADGHGPGGLRR